MRRKENKKDEHAGSGDFFPGKARENLTNKKRLAYNTNRCSEPLNQLEKHVMEKNPMRFNISVPQDLLEALRGVKKDYYPDSSCNEVLSDLIRRGLETVKEEKKEK